MALAFSRSMVTSTCGSLAEKVVIRPVRSLLARLAADDLVGDAVEVGEGVAARVLQHELEAAEAADALRRPGARTAATSAAVGGKHEHLQLGRKSRHDVGGGVTFAAALVGGLGGDEHHARSWRAPPEKLKPMTEKAPAISGSWRMTAAARSARPLV